MPRMTRLRYICRVLHSVHNNYVDLITHVQARGIKDFIDYIKVCVVMICSMLISIYMHVSGTCMQHLL